MPDFNLYFRAAEFSHLYHFDKMDLGRYQTLVCGQTLQPAHRIFYSIIIVFGNWPWLGLVAPHSKPISLYGLTTELLLIQDPILWAFCVVIYLYQLFNTTALKTFTDLQAKVSLATYSFRAIKAQFPDSSPSYVSLPMLDIIMGSNPAKLMSTLYTTLLTPSKTKLAYHVKVEV